MLSQWWGWACAFFIIMRAGVCEISSRHVISRWYLGPSNNANNNITINYLKVMWSYFPRLYLRNRSAPAVNCWVIIHCLEVSCKEDQITSAQRKWFIFAQLTDKQWIITQQFTQWSWSISILTHNKRRKHIRSLQLLPTFRHCTEELPPIFRLRRVRLHVIVTSFKRKNDVTPSNAMNDVIFQWHQLSHTFAVNYCPIYHSLLPLAL